MTSRTLYQKLVTMFSENDVTNGGFIAKELILFYGKKHFSLEYDINSSCEKQILDGANRVIKGEPIAYIFSQWDFMGRTFFVDKNVLIPRADTEILVELASNEIKKTSALKALDICTGSGCIAISLALDFENLYVTALDISEKALEITEKNAKEHSVSEKICIKRLDVLKDTLQTDEKFDIIVSNPPYIKNSDVKMLDKSVIDYEPTIALDGGESGLIFYEAIAKNFKRNLKENGAIFFESGYDNAEEVAKILEQNGYSKIQIKKDLAGNNRVVIAYLERTFNE
ncbi:MAG: peptide chain release factor N(5)-glutamine methyltransferase [Clostridia bacterium]